ncbi:MAG: hypothetical protein JW797_11985 [Bradymonadales bacterium]|nr:hypothetical protein [Bradymonadales bacterium]
MVSNHRVGGIVLLAAVLSCLAASRVTAAGFGELGVGTQVLVVDGDQGSQRGVGFDLRTRFLWILGLDFSVTSLGSTPEVWMPPTYRLGLLIHPWTSKYFDCFLNPGIASDAVADLFDPEGTTTWFRLGGGAEVRFLDGFALGFEFHWTVPGQARIEQYIDQHKEELLEQYLMALGGSQELPTSLEEVSASDLIDLLPLDRFEFTIGVRYYF